MRRCLLIAGNVARKGGSHEQEWRQNKRKERLSRRLNVEPRAKGKVVADASEAETEHRLRLGCGRIPGGNEQRQSNLRAESGALRKWNRTLGT